jgi:RHS repeat-associated protein
MYSVFDGGLSIQEYEPVVPMSPSGGLQTSDLRTEFVRGEGMGGGVGGMVYSIKRDLTPNTQNLTPTIICSHANHRGDVIARSDETGSLTSFALYEAYGTRPYEWPVGGTGDPDRQKANTKEEESDLGLLNEGFRYRDLETGTFLTRDPIGYADGPNVYCYVHCNPITKFDALGLSEDDPLDDEKWRADDLSEDEGIIGDSIDAITYDADKDGNRVRSEFSKTELGAKIINSLRDKLNNHQISFSAFNDYTAEGKDKPNGNYNPASGFIRINENHKDNPIQTASTMAHEGHHSVQSPYFESKEGEREARRVGEYVKSHLSSKTPESKAEIRRFVTENYPNNTEFDPSPTPGIDKIEGLLNKQYVSGHQRNYDNAVKDGNTKVADIAKRFMKSKSWYADGNVYYNKSGYEDKDR